jgi:Rhodanese-like domain
MAKAPQSLKASSNISPAVLIAGAIVVVALLAFSFSRTMRAPAAPASIPSSGTEMAAQPSVPSATATQAGEIPSSFPPGASPRAGSGVPSAAIQPPIETAAPPTQGAIAAVPRIKAGELLQKYEAKQVTIIDVRDVDSYKARHIPGSLHIPLSYIAGEVSYLPKDKPIVTYCT